MRQVIDRHQVQELVGAGARLIDVLPSREYGQVHIPGAVNLPLTQLDRNSTGGFEKAEPLIVYCYDLQ